MIEKEVNMHELSKQLHKCNRAMHVSLNRAMAAKGCCTKRRQATAAKHAKSKGSCEIVSRKKDTT